MRHKRTSGHISPGHKLAVRSRSVQGMWRWLVVDVNAVSDKQVIVQALHPGLAGRGLHFHCRSFGFQDFRRLGGRIIAA